MKNRIADELKTVEARHQRFAKMFSPEVINSRVFKREQLREVQQLLSKYRRGLNPDERLYRKLLNQQRRQMERQLYPNVLIRLVRNLAKLVWNLANAPFRAGRNLRVNLQVRKVMDKAGIGEVSREVAKDILQNKESFSKTLFREVEGGGKLEYSVNFSARDRRYSLPDFRVSLTGTATKDASSAVLPREYLSLNPKKLKNFLEGRPVKVGDGKWLEIDTSDKDRNGNFRYRTVQSVGYDISALLRKPEAKELSTLKLRPEMVRRLEAGEQIAIVVRGRQVNVSADPRGQSLSVTDQNGKKVDLTQTNKVYNRHVVKMEPSKSRANGITL